MALYTSTPPEGATQKIWGHLAPYPGTHYPTQHAVHLKGGYRSVASTTAREAIPMSHRKHGMKVYVDSLNRTFRLAANLSTWNEVSGTSGSNTSIAKPYVETAVNDSDFGMVYCVRWADGRLEYYFESIEFQTHDGSNGWWYDYTPTHIFQYSFYRKPVFVITARGYTGLMSVSSYDISASTTRITLQDFSPTNGVKGKVTAHIFGRWKA